MAKKIKSTRTINPLHFEDLEPRRFEDLVRRLLYSFKDWSDIEPTGRGGNDDGFDARAWERTRNPPSNVGDDGDEGSKSLEGNLWQIQSKREKTINPSKMRSFIDEGVDESAPPHGYILAAATNISKSSYDAFRNSLKAKGVIECYFWGKDYLEDKLSLPENDDILFTFFGISLSPRRKSRTAEVKFGINNKNKLLKLVIETQPIDQGVFRPKAFLLRDIKDDHYPYSAEYPDFDVHRRWEEHSAVQVTPLGVYFKAREWYVYFDHERNERDCLKSVDLTTRRHNLDRKNQARNEDLGRDAERFWVRLPQKTQGKLLEFGFLGFEDMLVIDDKGDPVYSQPHIFVDFGTYGPFRHFVRNLRFQDKTLDWTEIEKLPRASVFPAEFANRQNPNVFTPEELGIGPANTDALQRVHGVGVLYVFKPLHKLPSVGDLIHIPPRDERSTDKHAEITYLSAATVGDFLKASEQPEYMRAQLEARAGRNIADADSVTAYEIREVYFSSTTKSVIYHFRDGE